MYYGVMRLLFLINQWGRYTSSPVTFPLKFPSACYCVNTSSDQNYYKTEHVEVKSVSTSQFTYVGWVPTVPDYTAIGY